MAEKFTHNRDANQYEVTIDGRPAGEAHYTPSGDVIVFDHTLVPPEFGGRGVAGRLVRYALDDVRAHGEWRVQATCPFVRHWLATHPDYAGLLA